MSDTGEPSAIGDTAAGLKAVGDAARQVGDKAGQAATDAYGKAKDVAGEAKDRASSLLGAAGAKASSVAEDQKQNVAGYLDDVAKAVHRSGEQLEGHQDWIAHMVERGADELGVLANTLRTNDLQSLLGELGSLARRQPALFIGASMAAGFALARVGRIAATGATTGTGPKTTGPGVGSVEAGKTGDTGGPARTGTTGTVTTGTGTTSTGTTGTSGTGTTISPGVTAAGVAGVEPPPSPAVTAPFPPHVPDAPGTQP